MSAENLTDYLTKALPVLGLALLGAMVRLLHTEGEITPRRFLTGALTGLFAGALAFLALQEWDFSVAWEGALVGLVGYAAGDLLPVAATRLCKLVERYGDGGRDV